MGTFDGQGCVNEGMNFGLKSRSAEAIQNRMTVRDVMRAIKAAQVVESQAGASH